MKPLVSVIIPNYNHAPYLKERIDSVLNQTYQDFELIIFDDCSTDNSKEIIEPYRNHPKVSSIVYNEINSGSTFKQWQKGLKLAQGEYIWIAESDDYCTNVFLQNAVDSLEQNTNAAIFFCQSSIVNETSNIVGSLNDWTKQITNYNWHQSFKENGKTFIKNCLLNRNVIANASAVLFRKVVGLDNIDKITDYKKCGDWLFWGLVLTKYDVVYDANEENFFRSHANTTRVLVDFEQVAKFTIEQISVKQKLCKAIGLKSKKAVLEQLEYLVTITSIKNLKFISNFFKNKGESVPFNFYFLFLKLKSKKVIKRFLS